MICDPRDLERCPTRERDSLSIPGAPSRHSVDGPYRDRRDGLIARRRRVARELDAARRAAATATRLAQHLAVIDDELSVDGGPLLGVEATPTPSLLTLSARAARWVAECVIAGASAGAVVAVILVIASGLLPAGASLEARARPGIDRAHPVTVRPPPVRGAVPTPPIDRPVTTAAIATLPTIDRRALDRHVRWIAPQTWEIDRGLVQLALRGDIPLHGPRLLPLTRGGAPIGVRVHGVRRGALAGRLGLENGDIVLDVNGLPLPATGSLDVALASGSVAQRLVAADALFVRLERRGEERLHVYRIVD
jgi:hypothetical protein